jgi:hypothetical protein
LIGVEITFLEDGREKGLGETGNPDSGLIRWSAFETMVSQRVRRLWGESGIRSFTHNRRRKIRAFHEVLKVGF